MVGKSYQGVRWLGEGGLRAFVGVLGLACVMLLAACGTPVEAGEAPTTTRAPTPTTITAFVASTTTSTVPPETTTTSFVDPSELDTAITPEPTALEGPPELDDTYYANTPLVVELADRTIVFSNWFFVLLDGTATVTVLGPDGAVLLEGPAEGPNAVMREVGVDGGDFEFFDGDKIVAFMTQEEFSAAINAQAKANGVGAGNLGPDHYAHTPLVVELADRTIIFSNWFFVLLDQTAIVTVLGPDGEVLLEGPAEGADAVMREAGVNGGDFEFLDGDTVVAFMTQQEFNYAIQMALGG